MLGCLDLCINWRACTHQEDYGAPAADPEVRVLISALGLALLIVAVTAGLTSYRNWRALSAHSAILNADAVERREFVAVLGVIVSVTMGMGILWLSLPPLFLDICWRSR
jgi:divalent metal cation (Fe/Co/Zn/Cd) transporter